MIDYKSLSLVLLGALVGELLTLAFLIFHEEEEEHKG
jgi:hypothetical protein